MSSDPKLSRKQRRAAGREERKAGTATAISPSNGSSGPSMLVISLAALGIGLVAVIALVLVSGTRGGDGSDDVVEPDTAAPPVELRVGRTLVAADAVSPVVVEAYEDPQCVHCGTFSNLIEPLLVAGPVADGTASFTYHDFVIYGDESFDASVAMRVAEEMEGAFWDFNHILFANQAGVEDGSFSRERLADMAEIIGLDRDDFLSRLDDEDLRRAVLDDRARGEALGVASTPSIVVNGELHVGVPSWEDLRDMIEDAAAGA